DAALERLARVLASPDLVVADVEVGASTLAERVAARRARRERIAERGERGLEGRAKRLPLPDVHHEELNPHLGERLVDGRVAPGHGRGARVCGGRALELAARAILLALLAGGGAGREARVALELLRLEEPRRLGGRGRGLRGRLVVSLLVERDEPFDVRAR